jgi:2-polyprenyl-3-methyl-5-hydroxy-6-metoxy-1,4-benzoquinol methylase
MDDPPQTTRAHWEAWATCNETSAAYDRKRFKSGQLSLKSIEREELGDGSGKSLLHLQCPLGMDPLSWAWLGAKVTGMDSSQKAIAIAQA